jgi:hypothetical protein
LPVLRSLGGGGSAGRFANELRPGGEPLDTLGALSLSKRRRPYTHFVILDIIDKARAGFIRMAWMNARETQEMGSGGAHASRVPAWASSLRHPNGSRRDAGSSTRDGCAPRTIRIS